jgi:CysZ protein
MPSDSSGWPRHAAALKLRAMLMALVRALAALSAPPLRRIVGLGLGLAALSFALLWFAVAVFLHETVRFSWRPLDWLVEALGGLAVLGLSWLLFPAVVTLVMGFFLDGVAAAVEARDFPAMSPPRRRPLGESIAATARLGALSIVLNLAALPLYLLVPGINIVLFLGLNGYLLGREYFEVVALRRLDAAAAKAMRNRFGGRVFIGGVAIAGLFVLPLVNLVAPVVATAFMVHLFEALRRAEPHSLTRSAV